MSHEKIASLFDDWAHSGRGERMEQGHSDVVEQVIDKLNIRPGYQVLDLGCGIGWATRILAQKNPGVQAIGLDASPAMIKKAEELSSLRIRARYDIGTFESLDFPDGKFDQVFSMEALYYSPDLGQAISEFCRVLKSGGQANVVVDCYSGRPTTDGWGEATGLELHQLTPEEWKGAFEAGGFSKVELAFVVDRRGPGEQSEFTASDSYPDWGAYQAYIEAGSLWIQAEKA
jgi:ubiquinone/menaquinone biosynthesis C-methylase UbiE